MIITPVGAIRSPDSGANEPVSRIRAPHPFWMNLYSVY